ncbi:hypothetical protein NDU88_010333 [Pleurodeles waltl]|uniref:Uncharacterized protein n=1 Tax=Pleurodeles waltl TaxID=8319 RepID=A0AAV7PZS8_PLEWA|nr:hypothetical protein NDU88_010333 [Pleurodeles waltl]
MRHPPRHPQRERDWREARRPLSVPQRPEGEIAKAGLGKAQIPAPAVGRKRGKIYLGPGTEEDPGTGNKRMAPGATERVPYPTWVGGAERGRGSDDRA